LQESNKITTTNHLKSQEQQFRDNRETKSAEIRAQQKVPAIRLGFRSLCYDILLEVMEKVPRKRDQSGVRDVVY
jgi:hypothetical protein